MSRTIARNVHAIETALRDHFEADGHNIIDKDGILYARLIAITEDGAHLLGEINISTLAQDIERRLS